MTWDPLFSMAALAFFAVLTAGIYVYLHDDDNYF